MASSTLKSSSLPTLVRQAFKAAQESGDLTFYATRVAVLQCEGLPFQLRYSPALANKPKSNKSPASKPIDPFENPAKGLFITDVSSDHYLVLNKFPVIPDHFILATKTFKKQTNLLEENDLGAAYDCLDAYREHGEELFGFFNSGDHSGASQPHRHIQFLPVDSMRSGIANEMTWNVLADRLAHESDSKLPFTYFSSPIVEHPTASQLHETYIRLHKQACLAMGLADTASQDSDSAISYNLGLTDRSMVLCPRISEGTKITSKSGTQIGPISLNGTVLGGTLLVKSEEEWDAMQDDGKALTKVLRVIGINPKASHEHDERL